MNIEKNKLLKCLACNEDFATYNKFKSHIKWTHKMKMYQYREKYKVPVIAHNKIYDNPLTTVKCHICGKEFNVDTTLYQHRIRKGKTRFACLLNVKGKRSDCVKKLQSITIKEIRGTKESKEKTVKANKISWKNNYKARYEAAKKGMKSSEKYQNRGIKISAAKNLNPEKNSEAIRKAWDTRGRSEYKTLEFDCATCGKHVIKELAPADYEQRIKIKKHYCSRHCQQTRNKGKKIAVMDTRNCLLCSKEIVKTKAYFDSHSNYRGFYCCAAHQRKFIKIYGLPESALKKIKEFRNTQVFAEKPNKKESLIIPIVEPLGFKYVGNNAFKIDNLNPDFVNEDRKIILEHMGCFWHRCPICYSGKEHELRRTARTGYRRKIFENAGYKVIFLWEHELKNENWKKELVKKLSI